MEIDSIVITAIISVVGTIVVAWLAYQAKRLEAKSGRESAGVTALTSAVAEWKHIAERAEDKADQAIKESHEAKLASQRSEQDTVSLVEYLRMTWAGIMKGVVPPPMPIPERLKHLIDEGDFPWETQMPEPKHPPHKQKRQKPPID